MARTLIKCGWIVSVDRSIGDLKAGEILIDRDRIVAVGPNLHADADAIIDATDMIAMPGLVNAHLHTWQTGLRAIGCEWAHGDYFRFLHGGMAALYRPEDNYLGNLIGALNQIDGGVTTLNDYCHNITSTEQAERSVDALEDAGIRAVFSLGAGKLPPDREKIEPFERRINPRERVEKFRKGRLASDDRLVIMALAVSGPHWSETDANRINISLARELGLRSSSHATKRPELAVDPRGYFPLLEEGLVGEDHTIVHGNYLSDGELKRLIDAGVTACATVQTELRGYAGDPLIGRVRALGQIPALGIDVEPRVSGEMFREMQIALLYALSVCQRENARDNKPAFTEVPIRSREALAWATIGGARALGLEHLIGTLTPGKKADIVLLDGADLNLYPVHDPVLSIVEQANQGNVDTVFIDGVIQKSGGKLRFPEGVMRRRMAELAISVERLMGEAGYAPFERTSATARSA
jgi:cytosine/adenosine deaminase-related metal-dependent hydrolase